MVEKNIVNSNMKNFKEYLKESGCRLGNTLKIIEEDIENSIKEGKYTFVQLKHTDDVIDEGLEQVDERATKSVIVNHGSFELKKGTGAKTNIQGNVVKVDPVQRLELLKKGWQDFIPVSKQNDDGTYTRMGVDPRDFMDYVKQGFRKGWQKDNEIYNPQTKKHKPVFPEQVDKFINKGWKKFEPTVVSKIIPTKSGSGKTDIRKIDRSELDNYVKNGYEEGVKHTDSYFDSFSIQTTNGKLGHVGNFSMTPIDSCPKGVPCGGDCYAKKCYDQYPDCKEAWDKNFKLMKEHPDWLVSDMDMFFMTDGRKMDKFRWQVSGDLIDANQLLLVNQIARNNPNVTFWLYTKNIDLLHGFSPAKNLVVIISAWNDWKLDEIEKLHKDFPVAYFDDWNHKDLIPKDEDAFICPCADDKSEDVVDDRHCETCKTHSERKGVTGTHPCYMLQPGESLIFRKH